MHQDNTCPKKEPVVDDKKKKRRKTVKSYNNAEIKTGKKSPLQQTGNLHTNQQLAASCAHLIIGLTFYK